MKKKQDELFNIPENEVIEAEPPVAKAKATRKKKAMTDAEKSVLIDRLKAGRERKKAEREGNKSVKVIEPPAEAATPSPVTRPAPRPLTPHPTDREILKQQLEDLKKEIRDTKEKEELNQMKNEMKELKLLLQNSNKRKSNENLVADEVKPPPLKSATPTPSQNAVTQPVQEIKPIQTTLKKRFK